MTQQYYSGDERRSDSDPANVGRSRWWWAILAPYVFIPLGIGGMVLFGSTGAAGPVRLLFALGLILGAGLVHLGLYRDAHGLRTSGSHWVPHYWQYAIGGAVAVLGPLLFVDVSLPGGLLAGILLAVVFGVFVTAPIYLLRRYLTVRQQ